MITLLALHVALAKEPYAAATSAVAVEQDFSGGLMVPFWQTAWVGAPVGSSHVEAYGELAWPSGVDERIVPRMYVLSVDGRKDAVDWTVGRQRIDLPQYPRLMDGGRVRWHGRGMLSLEAWAGWAEHPATPWTEGAAVGRMNARVEGGKFTARAGGWVEGGPTSDTAFHPDIDLRWAAPDAKRAPSLSLMAAAGIGNGDAVIERGRAELGFRPVSGTRAELHFEHRDVLDASSPLAGDILATFAPQGTDEIGVGFGWSNVRRDELWMSGSAQTWDQDDAAASPLSDGTGRQAGARGEVSWRQHCDADAWCVRPTWRGAIGPGGSFQAIGGSVATPLPGPVSLGAHAFVVPWHTMHQAWTTAAVVGLDGDLHLSPIWGVTLGVEVSHDIVANVDARGWAALRVALR